MLLLTKCLLYKQKYFWQVLLLQDTHGDVILSPDLWTDLGGGSKQM